ncbi:single-stranded DNA-binding protein [Mesomycoplasma ovipneumoniae]|uniref:single-stranded DNA-binding protein n=1 Tax=Mesomycoplasma ovipneumoniae TaxID=29562 RepID=UPI0028AAC5D8|nr:single-stranded DNA-binding protein [Mesomycoplasma ovipneumoniae]WNM14788.1 single-stranded DNA-binding protein [Mesomycoplasma ovipneumoniae]
MLSNNFVPENLYFLSENEINLIWTTFENQIFENGWVNKSDFIKLVNQQVELKEIDVVVAKRIISNLSFLISSNWIKVDKSFSNFIFAKNKYEVLEFYFKENSKENLSFLNSFLQTRNRVCFLTRKFPFDDKYINFKGQLEDLNKETKNFILDELIKTIIEDFETGKDKELFLNILDEAENFGDWKPVELAMIQNINLEIDEDINFIEIKNNKIFDYAKLGKEVLIKFLKNNNSIEYLFSKYSEMQKELDFEKKYIFALVQKIKKTKFKENRIMLNKVLVVGQVVSAPFLSQTNNSSLNFVRFKIEVKNKNSQKPTNFYLIGFGSKTKITNEISIGDLIFVQGPVSLSSFQNPQNEKIFYLEIKINDYQIISKNHSKPNHSLDLKNNEKFPHQYK